ncbi:lef2 [Oxyplax ochracea nucleopolyhedrovirus]|uniref:Lef2 n=1 Tax=Oxyplax ochracea nucleopolyhedrovirus TaxID=2083176 RepID=A0A2L0WU95_9ABAC|nr:lef2 [Oxyplax ochracea nucleopolyhedrovirus]AVA31223.1 lef2 [Oxyplax ochracea nucleopolyhedrovirus]
MTVNMEIASSKNIKLWSPETKIDKSLQYLVNPNDFLGKITLSPLTEFESGGELIKTSGLRLLAIIDNNNAVSNNWTKSKNDERKNKSKKNLCMKLFEKDFFQIFTSKIKIPPCIKKIVTDIKNAGSARGGMYRKRFILNCYILNVIVCNKCDNRCFLTALQHFYNFDAKCVNELTRLFFKTNDDLYKPPNCQKMKTVDKLCPFAGRCKGMNPICNY